jgi:signal transduction histidine kinase
VSEDRTSDPVEAGLVRVDAAFAAALNALRTLTLAVAYGTYVLHRDDYQHPGVAVGVLLGITGWSAYLWSRGSRRPPATLLVLDVAVTCAAILLTLAAATQAQIDLGVPTVPTLWAGVAIADVAVWAGWSWGLLAALTVAVTTLVERGGLSRETTNSIVLAILLAVTVGRLAELLRITTRRALMAERAAAVAESERAAALDRERLARDVHDGVLQLLAIVARADPPFVLPDDRRLGAAAAEAGEQLRRLLTDPGRSYGEGRTDVLGLLPQGPRVHLAVPAGPVLLPSAVAEAVAAIARAAVDNTRLHVGLDATSWVVLDVQRDGLQLRVRDDGPPLGEGALTAAGQTGEHGGRMGIAGMRARAAEVGGTLRVGCPPGSGLEIELDVPLEEEAT